MSWEYVKLKDIATIIMGQSPKSEYFNSKGEGIPFMQGKTEFGEFYPTIVKYTTMKTRIAKNNSILFTVRAPVGALNIANQDICIGRGLASIDSNDGDNNFLYYLIKNHHNLFLSESGEGVYDSINKTNLNKVKLFIPSNIELRKKIGAILGAYDDLIENNLKRIKLLEQAAQNIYKEWFVNLRFPGHENTPINEDTGLPEGWEEVKIGDLLTHEIGGGWGKEKIEENFDNPAYVIRGTDFPKIETGNLKDIPFRFHKKSNLKTRNLNAGDIIFEVSGGSTNAGVARSLLITEKLITNLGNDAMCASFCKLMRPKNTSYSYLLFLRLKYLKATKITEVYEKRSASNIVNYNWNAFLSDVGVPIPTGMLLTKFCTIAHDNMVMQDVLRSQIGHLKAARDILLPRLMNRTIEV
jgi:type I restriction enzyme, S subunit